MVFTFHACKTAPRLGRWPTLQKIRAGRFYRHSFDGTHRPRWVRTGLMRRLIISLFQALGTLSNMSIVNVSRSTSC